MGLGAYRGTLIHKKMGQMDTLYQSAPSNLYILNFVCTGFSENMVRTYKKKTERAGIDEATVHLAVSEVIEGGLSIRKTAMKYNLKTATLQHRIEKARKQLQGGNKPEYSSKYCSHQVFSKQQERLLTEYGSFSTNWKIDVPGKFYIFGVIITQFCISVTIIRYLFLARHIAYTYIS